MAVLYSKFPCLTSNGGFASNSLDLGLIHVATMMLTSDVVLVITSFPRLDLATSLPWVGLTSSKPSSSGGDCLCSWDLLSYFSGVARGKREGREGCLSIDVVDCMHRTSFGCSLFCTSRLGSSCSTRIPLGSIELIQLPFARVRPSG